MTEFFGPWDSKPEEDGDVVETVETVETITTTTTRTRQAPVSYHLKYFYIYKLDGLDSDLRYPGVFLTRRHI